MCNRVGPIQVEMRVLGVRRIDGAEALSYLYSSISIISKKESTKEQRKKRGGIKEEKSEVPIRGREAC